MSSCMTRTVVDTSIHSVSPDLVDMSRRLFMLCKAAKAPSALPMIQFMYFIADSLNDNPIAAASNETFLFGSFPRTMGCRCRFMQDHKGRP